MPVGAQCMPMPEPSPSLRAGARLFRCPACALSEQAQSGSPVRVTERTEYLTGAGLSPNEAYVVRGSDMNMCARPGNSIGADRSIAGLSYDRCAPSLIAFAHGFEAFRFSRAHGGTVLPFREVQAASANAAPVSRPVAETGTAR
jgi:hypothetical protein